MTTTLADRAAAILTTGRRVAVALSELAAWLDAAPHGLIDYLERDDRFLVIRPTAFPDLTELSEDDRRRYAEALERAGVQADTLVLLVSAEGLPGDATLDHLLRDSVLRVAAHGLDQGLATSAERLRVALVEAISPG